MNNHKIIFATQDYQYLQKEIIENGSFQKGIIITKQFPDGEIYHQIETQVLQQSVVLIGGTIDDKNTLELYDLAHGIIQAGAKSLSIIIPYFGYATMERAVKAGEIVKAKNRALLFSSLPPCAEPNTVFLLDLHSDGIPYYFGSDVRCKHLYAKKIVLGSLHDLDVLLYEEILTKLDFSKYANKAVILKGCSKKPVPQQAYCTAMVHLQKFAKSVMYGEACSAVPLFKK